MPDKLHKVVVRNEVTVVVLAADVTEAQTLATEYAKKNAAGVTKPSAHFAVTTTIVSAVALE